MSQEFDFNKLDDILDNIDVNQADLKSSSEEEISPKALEDEEKAILFDKIESDLDTSNKEDKVNIEASIPFEVEDDEEDDI